MKWIRKKLIELKDTFRCKMEEYGGLHIFLLATLIILLVWPFLLLYFLLLRPIIKGVRMLLEIKKLGLKASYRKQFHSDEYEKELSDKKREEEKTLNESLLPNGKQKRFEDRKDWPDAYTIDGKAIYGAEGRTLIYVAESVEEFDVPEGVVSIYHRCFACCEKLKCVSLPSSLKRIGKRAFYGCVSLKEVVVPESVYILDEEMFMNCTSLEHIVLPSQTTEIFPRMFCNCRSLREFSLPERLKIIEVEAFKRCYSLERIKTNEQLELIMERAFEECHYLKDFVMPETVRSIRKGIFNGCHSLEHIHLSSQIKDFGGSCCHECWSINQISMTPMDEKTKDFFRKQWEEYADKVDITTSENPFPESTFWTMGDTLYFGIPRLTTVWLVYCFSKASEFTVPSFVTNIKPEAFSSCKNLRTLRLSPYLETSLEAWEQNGITYGFVYDFWPQIKNIIFDETLKNTKYAFGLIA